MRLKRLWPLCVWVALAGVAALLYVQSGGFVGMVGVVEAVAEPVAPLETARLKAVHVVPGQRVKAGEALVEMDASLLYAELELERARVAEAKADAARAHQNMVRLLRDAEAEIRDARKELAIQQMERDRDAARLAQLKIDRERRLSLRARGLLEESETVEHDPAIADLEAAATAFPAVIRAHRDRLTQAEAEGLGMRRQYGLAADADLASAFAMPAAAAADVLARVEQVLELRHRRYTLRAGRDGTVSRVFHAPGNTVAAGEAVVRLIASRPEHVIGFLPESHVTGMETGQKVQVHRRDVTGHGVPGSVVYVGAEVQNLPGRVSPIRGQPLRGRRVTVRLDGEHAFLPGETVEIRPPGGRWQEVRKRLRVW